MPDVQANSWRMVLQCDAKKIISSIYMEYCGISNLIENIQKYPFGVKDIYCDSTKCVSLAGALHLLTCASRSETAAVKALRDGLKTYKVGCTQATDAPRHPRSETSGEIQDIHNNEEFWEEVWRDLGRRGVLSRSSSWLNWLLKGGLLFDRVDIEYLSASLIQKRVDAESEACRVLHPHFLQITDLIGIELRKSQKEIYNEVSLDFKERLRWDDFLREFHVNPIKNAGSLEKYFILEGVFSKIKSLIKLRKLNPLIFDFENGELRDVEFDDIVGSHAIFGSHSFGLLGDRYADKFLLFRKSDAFSAMEWNAVEEVVPTKKEKGKRGRPKGTSYNDEFFVDQCISRILSGKFRSRSKAIKDVIYNYPEIIGNTDDAKESRLAAGVRLKLGPVQR